MNNLSLEDLKVKFAKEEERARREVELYLKANQLGMELAKEVMRDYYVNETSLRTEAPMDPED